MLLIRLIVGRLGRETDLRLLLLCSFEVPQEPGNSRFKRDVVLPGREVGYVVFPDLRG